VEVLLGDQAGEVGLGLLLSRHIDEVDFDGLRLGQPVTVIFVVGVIKAPFWVVIVVAYAAKGENVRLAVRVRVGSEVNHRARPGAHMVHCR